MPKWPTQGQSVSAIHQGHQPEDQQSTQATGCADSLHFQRYPQEIPHESDKKTRDDGREGCGCTQFPVLNAQELMLERPGGR